MTRPWPEGLAVVTIRWPDGTELVANKVKVMPEDLSLETEHERILVHPDRIPAYLPMPALEGRFRLDAKMFPDNEDVFYTFKERVD